MKGELLNLMVCPACKEGFTADVAKESNGQILEGTLICPACGTLYPIIAGIPRILSASQVEKNYSKNFEYYWTRLNWKREVENRKRFYELTEYRPQDLKGKLILDAGAGGGRWTWVMAEAGATVIALDYKRAIEYAKDICHEYPNVDYV